MKTAYRSEMGFVVRRMHHYDKRHIRFESKTKTKQLYSESFLNSQPTQILQLSWVYLITSPEYGVGGAK